MQHLFWREEMRDFPRTRNAARLWAARLSGRSEAPVLEMIHEYDQPGHSDRPPGVEQPPLSRMYRTAIDGLSRCGSVRTIGEDREAVEFMVRVEAVRHRDRIIGVCAVSFADSEIWGDTIRFWLLRFCSRLAPLMETLPPAAARFDAAPQLPALFPASVLAACSLERHAVQTPAHHRGEVSLPSPAYLPDVPGIAGISTEMRDCCRSLLSAAQSDVNILLHGESGTGKELLARAVHDCSRRHDKPFIGLNCAALPDSLFESELFGHKAGAFTGAGREKPGLLEAADKGTFFLDEIGDMPLALQIKLLRVMQEKSLRRIGDLDNRAVDVRFVSASHKNLEQEIQAGRFRLDLYYRLKVVSIEIPPLRRRPEDLLHLLAVFLHKRDRRPQYLHLELRALEAMQRYRWPGNVRELENEVNRWCALYPQASVMRLDDLSLEIRKAMDRSVDPADLGTLRTMSEATEMMEKFMIRKAIGVCNGRKSEAARRLGLSRQGLYKKIKRYGMGDLLQAPA